MEQKEFDRILSRYLDSTASEAEKALVDEWYHLLGPSLPLSRREKAPIKRRLKATLRAHQAATMAGIRPAGRSWNRFQWAGLRLAFAAGSLLVMSSLFLLFVDSPSVSVPLVQDARPSWTEVVSSGDGDLLLSLKDGSEIILQPGALLRYPVRFDSSVREVRLERGSACFDVKRDETHPFLVYSGDIVTQVLGTSFSISTGPDGRVTVDVHTGSVRVAAHLSPAIREAERPETILTPNQRAAYDPKRNEIVRTLVEKPKTVLPVEEVKAMVFKNAPVIDVLQAIERAYQVRIDFDRGQFSACRLTTHLVPGEDLYTRLKIICEAIGAHYRSEDGVVVISGEGC